MRRALLNAIGLGTVLATGLGGVLIMPAAGAPDVPDRTDRPLPEHIAESRLDDPIQLDQRFNAQVLHPTLVGATGTQQVLVTLEEESLAESDVAEAGQASRVAALERAQDQFIARTKRADRSAKVLGQVQRVLNAVALEVDADTLDELADDPEVVRITPVRDYEVYRDPVLNLDETVPYIGAAAVHDTGFDGTGVRVAVLDTGIDYTHAALGGEGTAEAYEAAYGTDPSDPRNTTTDGLFPTDRVVDGFDFVGEAWPNGDLAPDPDPIDFDGHGTHVADIIGGEKGVAPDADLYAVKVCSSVTPSCSGVALLQAMDWAVDPNGDGRTNDRVDIINMSLGSDWGQPFDDDLSQAVEGATELGVLTVAAAGNGSNKPFIVGTPSAAATALSVAQTQVPSATLPQLEVVSPPSIAGIYDAVFQPWSVEPTEVIEAPVQYGDGAGGNLLGCEPFAAGSLDALIVLVDRGTCNFSLKISNISVAGGVAGIIGLVTPDVPFAGADGGDRPIDIPGYMISQADNNTFKGALDEGVTIRIDPASGLPLIGTVVGSSSRGPQLQDYRIKPEIGAPGASVSAIAGSGDGTGPFGGTSGASPMVAGAAALLFEGFEFLPGADRLSPSVRRTLATLGRGMTPLVLKSLIMNNGETDIDTDPTSGPAPISRIGGGEVRVNQAFAAQIAAWDDDEPAGALSFGFHDVSDRRVTLTKTVRVVNFGSETTTYSVTPTFRFQDDIDNGAVRFTAPDEVTVRPGPRGTTFDVTMTINGARLRENAMSSGAGGADTTALTAQEYDGYLVLENGEHELNMAWHVLPRKASRVTANRTELDFDGQVDVIRLRNRGAGSANLDAYAALVVDEELPKGGVGEQAPTPDIAHVAVNTFPVGAGFCSADPSFVWSFAVDAHERATHAVAPASFWIDLDTDRDGTPDYAVFNLDLSGLPVTLSNGQNVAWVGTYLDDGVTLASLSAFFFTEHGTTSGNTILNLCAEQIGFTDADLLTTAVDAKAFAFDIYFGGPGDETDPFTITPLGERYVGIADDLGPRERGELTVIDFGPLEENTEEVGLLLVTNGDRSGIGGSTGASTEDTETILFTAE